MGLGTHGIEDVDWRRFKQETTIETRAFPIQECADDWHPYNTRLIHERQFPKRLPKNLKVSSDV